MAANSDVVLKGEHNEDSRLCNRKRLRPIDGDMEYAVLDGKKSVSWLKWKTLLKQKKRVWLYWICKKNCEGVHSFRVPYTCFTGKNVAGSNIYIRSRASLLNKDNHNPSESLENYIGTECRTVTQESLEGMSLPEDFPVLKAIEKPPLKLGGQYYVAQPNSFWKKATLKNILQPGEILEGITVMETMYRVFVSKYSKYLVVSGKEIAYASSSKVQLETGTRVIAICEEANADDVKKRRGLFYPGIIGEPLLPSNKFRIN